MLLFPKVAYRDCDHCRKNVYNEETGEPKKGRDGGFVKRPEGTLPPCEYGPDRCAKGHWSNPKMLSKKNQQFFQYYQCCKAVRHFDFDDAIVFKNSGIIRMLEDAAHQSRSNVVPLINALLSSRK